MLQRPRLPFVQLLGSSLQFLLYSKRSKSQYVKTTNLVFSKKNLSTAFYCTQISYIKFLKYPDKRLFYFYLPFCCILHDFTLNSQEFFRRSELQLYLPIGSTTERIAILHTGFWTDGILDVGRKER